MYVQHIMYITRDIKLIYYWFIYSIRFSRFYTNAFQSHDWQGKQKQSTPGYIMGWAGSQQFTV